ncbi:transposase, partial [Nonomuraea sp. NPDC004297]
MPAPRKYPQELRERAVRMVFEVREQSGNAPGAIARVAQQLGIHREALRGWVRQAEVDRGQRPGTSTADAQRIAELEREVRELRRTNEILKSAALDSNDQRNTASGWVDRGSDGSAGNVGRDERR